VIISSDTNRYVTFIFILFGQQQANDIQMISFEWNNMYKKHLSFKLKTVPLCIKALFLYLRAKKALIF